MWNARYSARYLNHGSRALGMFLAAVSLLAPVTVTAQIYKWVDEEGNVHFSDKPQPSGKAKSAETVELNSGYTPSTVSTQERQATEQARIARERRRAAEEKLAQEKLAERTKQREDQCERDRAKLVAITEVRIGEGGERLIYYLKDENGQPMKVDDQNAAIDKLREKIARDC